ncbi:MAG: GNAT family N-acetyltransferase [Anaerolineae bacterium]|nr:GNAT family N-acetyltransferase [Anaerolineae bacterium]
MRDIVEFIPAHLENLRVLINAHLDLLFSGWALTAEFIASRLSSCPEQPIMDPWVAERRTLCAFDRGRLVAAAHLLRYADDAVVSHDFRNAGDIAWFLAQPGEEDAGRELLTAARQAMRQWGVRVVYAWGTGLPVRVCSGIPNTWPHIRRLLISSGFESTADDEYIFGGSLDGVAAPDPDPVPGVQIRCSVTNWEALFSLWHENENIGHCECCADLTHNGRLPAFKGCGELRELVVATQWRNRGLGRWLVQHAVTWLRGAGCDRVIFSVIPSDDAHGAGRFYRRFGWDKLVTFEKGWLALERWNVGTLKRWNVLL